MNDHVLDDLEAYALGAIDERAAQLVAAHLAVCTSCREEASVLAEVVGTLPDTVAARAPRSSLRARILSAAAADAHRRSPARSWSLGSIRPGRIALAAVAAVFIVLSASNIETYQRLSSTAAERDTYYTTLESFRQGGRIWYMAGKDQFAGSGGTLVDPRADGKQPFVLFHDLPTIASGKILTVWLVSAAGTWARAATFVPDGHDIQSVQITTEVAGFDRCAVTLEDSSWGPRYGAVVMESKIAPPTPGG
jgi:hypothetical protein